LGLFDNPDDPTKGESGLFRQPQPRQNSRFAPKTPKVPTAPGVTAPGVPGVKAPAAPGKSELPPIFGAGQAALKGLMTSWAGAIEVADAALSGSDKPLTNASKNIATLWGPNDIFEPGAWDDLKDGKFIAEERLKMPEKMIYLSKGQIRVSDTPILGGVPLGSTTFWAGLGIDIGVDPLTYGTLGANIPIKVGAAFTRYATKGGRLAAAGEVAAKLAKSNVDVPPEILNERFLGNAKRLQREGLQGVRTRILETDPKAAQVVKKADEKFANNVYKTTRVTDPRTLTDASKDIVASALEAGVKAASNTYTVLNTAKFLREYAKRDVRRFPTRGLVANVVRNTDTGGYKVVSGNKITLAEAATKTEANNIAKQLRKGLETATNLAPVAAMAAVREGVEATQDSVKLPSTEGQTVEIQTMVPHQADNGSVYVYDGENVAEFDNLQDANDWVAVMSNATLRDELDVVVSGASGKYQVRAGDQITRFKTKRDAEAYANALRSGEIQGELRVTTGGTPIVDALPPTIPVKELLKAPTVKEASALKAVLKGVDDVAKKVSGWRPLVNKSVARQISEILSDRGQAQLDKILMRLNPRQLNVLKEFISEADNARGMLSDLEATGKVGEVLAQVIRNLRIETSKGTLKFGDMLNTAKGKFLNLSKAVEGVEGTGLEQQVIKQLKERIYERSQQLISRTVEPADTAAGKYQAIVAAAGEEVANKIQKTGHLDKPTEASKKKVDNILEQIRSGSEEVSYQGYDDLIAGLKRGDEVSATALDEIINLIDPEGGIRTAVTQAAGEPAAAFLTRLLTREGGVNTIYDAERRLALANDPEMLAKHAGLAYEAEVVALMNMSIKGNKEIAGSIEFATTKQNMAKSFSEYDGDVQRDAMDSAGRSLMGKSEDGTGGMMAYKASILEEATGGVRTSTLGDEIVSTGEAYADNSRAMFAKQLAQSDEVRIIGSILGKVNWRQKKAKARAAEDMRKFDAMTQEERLDYLTKRMSAVRDGLGGLGFRFVRTKNRNDIDFEKAYQAEIQRAKKTKTTPNFSALSLKHTAYLPMADIINATRQAGLSSLLKGFFPAGRVNYQRDTLDWIGFGDAARRVLEMDAAGEVFDVAEIASRIGRRGEGRLKPSAARQKILDEAAQELAEILTEPQVVAQLKAVHLDNAASIVQDFTRKAEDYSKALFDVLEEAWVAMHAADNLSEAARMNAVRLFLRKFVMTSDIMRLEGGPIAEAMFRASAMLFADGGKVLPEGKLGAALTKSEKEFYNLLRDEEMSLFREALTKWYRHADIPGAPVGREGMKAPKKAAQAKAQNELDTAMEIYAAHMTQLKTVEKMADLSAVKAWEKQMVRIQAKLNKARENAWNNWVPTYHWHPTDGWVLSEQFDHAAAVRSARNVHAQYVAGKQGLTDREMLMADTLPEVPPHRILSAAEKAKYLKRYREQMDAHLVNNAASVVDDISRNVMDEIEAGMLDDITEANGADKMMIATQNMMARAQKESTEIRIYTALASYKDKLPETDAEFNRLFRQGLDEDTPVLPFDRTIAKLKINAQRWSATTRGTSEAMTAARAAENRASQVIADYTSALDDLVRNMQGSTLDDMDAVWTSLRDDALLEGDSAIRQSMRDKLAPFVNAILRGQTSSVLAEQGIDGAMLGEAFARYGLNDEIGFPSIQQLSGKTPQEISEELFKMLPFGATPKSLKAGSAEAIAWQKSRDKFRKSGVPAPLVFSRMFSAVQQIKAEQGIAHNLTAQFGWKAHYPTIEAAKKAGWVQIEAAGKQNIARFLPSAENGNLFHPIVADDIARVFREWNAVYEGKALAPWLRSSMRLMGFLKFTQTTGRLGHHIVNILGDGSNAILFGARDAGTWADGADLATRFTRENFGAEYGQFGRDFEAKVDRIVKALNDMPGEKPLTRARYGLDAEATVNFTIYRNGKPTTVNFDREQVAADFAARGVFVPGFVQADIMNATNDIMLTGTSAGNKRAMQRIWSKVARPGHEVMRALSTGTAAYSNVIRGATAMRVAKSRAWGSYEEMMNAIVKEVNLIHPTVQSLASAEKRTGRLLFTYYTWLRVAHNALWDMAINNTGAFLAAPKFMYNYSLMQGFDPQSPAVPFESQNVLPGYLSYSVYGPNEMGPQGPRVNRPPFLVLDVLDFWKVYYDPSKTGLENALAMGGQVAGEVVGPSLNILGQPIAASLFASRTGQSPDPAQVASDTLGNLGITNLLTGLGAYTPYRYTKPDTTNPLTDADRQRILQNWLYGTRSQDLYRPINVKLGQSQYGSRLKDYNERIRQENLNKTQSFVDDRLSEGYTPDQIKEMLKQLGIR
jgi:hypothetical protein